MKRIWVTDAQVVSALGDDLETLWSALLSGKKGGVSVDRFRAENYRSGIAAQVPDLSPEPFPPAAGSPHQGAADQPGAVPAVSRIVSLMDRLLDNFGPVPADASLITATTKGAIDILEGICKKEAMAPSALPLSCFPDIVRRKLSLEQTGFNISAACASSTIAIARGAAMIAAGRADAVLVCCGDLVTEFVFSGFSALGALSPSAASPFDRKRNGLMLGEGAAALLLMAEGRAKREGRNCLGVVAGWGDASDAAHVTAPARDGCGLIRAIEKALEKAGIVADHIGGICAHGTGTVYNDMMELTAFESVFGQKRVPVTSVKGAIGHTLGAAGGIEAALGLRALREQVLPPTTGLSDPEEKGRGILSPLPQPMEGRYLLSTNSGFGGINAALVLARGDEKWPW